MMVVGVGASVPLSYPSDDILHRRRRRKKQQLEPQSTTAAHARDAQVVPPGMEEGLNLRFPQRELRYAIVKCGNPLGAGAARHDPDAL